MLLNCASVFMGIVVQSWALQSKVWVTKSDQSMLLSPQTPATFASDNPLFNGLVIDVVSSVKYQEMDGYGASLTDVSAWLMINKTNPRQLEDLLQSLFNRSIGIGMNMLRQPMGASDFALTTYSYDDTCCDTSDFSVSHDVAYIIPLLKRIKQINPELLIIGTPWSPPGWMKTQGIMSGTWGGILKTDQYENYANYFVKYIQAYQKEGLPIYAVTIQNEPRNNPVYPGMLMGPDEQINFIKKYLGPLFTKNNITTKIFTWDHNWDGFDYPITVLNDSSVRGYVAGTAFHCYGGNMAMQSNVHTAYPGKGIWLTECSSGSWMGGGEFPYVFGTVVSDLVISAARNWAKSMIKWNLALDELNGPTIYTKNSTCFGTVKIESSGKVTYNADYYSTGHASKFVRKGAFRIQSNNYAGQLESVAFKNPDGSTVLIVLNRSGQRTQFKVREGKQSFKYSLDSISVATFTW